MMRIQRGRYVGTASRRSLATSGAASAAMTSRIRLPSVRGTGIGDYHPGTCLHSKIAQPFGVPLAGSRKTDDGSRDRLSRWVVYAPVMKGLDSELESRDGWSLDRTSPHRDILRSAFCPNQKRSPVNMSQQETIVGHVPDQKGPKLLVMSANRPQ